MYAIVFLGIVSVGFSMILTLLVRGVFLHLGIVDAPSNPRKLHRRPIPRVGGVAIAAAYLLSFAALLVSRVDAGGIVADAVPFILRIIPAAALIFLTGFIDDVVGLRPWQKLLGEFAAGAAACWAGVRIVSVAGHAVPLWLSLPFTVVWLIGCTNAFNLIDGIDGLAAGIGFCATLSVVAAALLAGNMPLAMATVPLTGALLGFLVYNFNPASIFLGDSGSLLIGFLLGSFGIVWSQKSATVLGMTAPLMLLAVPLLDTALAIARRFLRSQPIFKADRNHIHHRLLQLGFSQRRVVLLLCGACWLGAVLALLATFVSERVAVLVLLLFAAATWAGVQRLHYTEFGILREIFQQRTVRRIIQNQLALRGFQDSLGAAPDPDACWDSIRASFREFGFHQVEMRVDGRFYSENGHVRPPGGCWTIHVPLSGSDYVELKREFGPAGRNTVVAPYVDILNATLKPKLGEFRNGRGELRAMHAGAGL